MPYPFEKRVGDLLNISTYWIGLAALLIYYYIRKRDKKSPPTNIQFKGGWVY